MCEQAPCAVCVRTSWKKTMNREWCVGRNLSSWKVCYVHNEHTRSNRETQVSIRPACFCTFLQQVPLSQHSDCVMLLADPHLQPSPQQFTKLASSGAKAVLEEPFTRCFENGVNTTWSWHLFRRGLMNWRLYMWQAPQAHNSAVCMTSWNSLLSKASFPGAATRHTVRDTGWARLAQPTKDLDGSFVLGCCYTALLPHSFPGTKPNRMKRCVGNC